MLLLHKRLRQHGVLRLRSDVARDKWHIGDVITERSSGALCLAVRSLTAAPGTGLLVELFDSHVVRADGETFTLRGIERALINDKPAAVIQELMFKVPPLLGADGLLSPLAQDITGWGRER